MRLTKAKKYIEFNFFLLLCRLDKLLSFPPLLLFPFNFIQISLHVLQESKNLIVCLNKTVWLCCLDIDYFLQYDSCEKKQIGKKNWNIEKLFSLFIFTCVIILSLKRHDYVLTFNMEHKKTLIQLKLAQYTGISRRLYSTP